MTANFRFRKKLALACFDIQNVNEEASKLQSSPLHPNGTKSFQLILP